MSPASRQVASAMHLHPAAGAALQPGRCRQTWNPLCPQRPPLQTHRSAQARPCSAALHKQLAPRNANMPILPAAHLLARHHALPPSCAGGRCCCLGASSAALHLRCPHARQLHHAPLPSPCADCALNQPRALPCSDTLRGQIMSEFTLLLAANAAGNRAGNGRWQSHLSHRHPP